MLTDANSPLVFSLDDIVLADENGNQNITDQDASGAANPLDDNSRYALFYVDYVTEEPVPGTATTKNLRRMKIYNPDPAEPVFTDFKFKENLIYDVPPYARAVYFCNAFYDVYDKRSDPSNDGFSYEEGHVCGARMALKNDPDAHVTKSAIATNEADLLKAHAQPNCGNYELHYLHNCAELDGKPLAYLIIHWSCRFELNPNDPSENPVPGGTPADVDNHRRLGMTNAMARLNKNYLIEKSSGDVDIVIRPFHYMEAKNDTNGGPHKALVNIVGNQHGAWMSIDRAQFRSRDYQPDPTYFCSPDPDNLLQDTDGATYAVLTNAHEMGHATGNWDEYLYSYEDPSGTNWFGLPRYHQPFTAEGGPYTCDTLSRMYHNRTPRLRNFWKYVCWLNDESKIGGALNKFLKGTRFKLTLEGIDHTHNFELDDIYRNVALPAKSKSDHEIGPDARADLFLYQLGDDELSRLIKSGQTFRGILVVRTKFAIEFVKGTSAWTFNDSLAWAQRLNNDVKNTLNMKFRMSCEGENDLGKTAGSGSFLSTDFPKIVSWVSEVAKAQFSMHDL